MSEEGYSTEIFGWSVDTPVHEAIGQAVGAASMCWEFPERAGVFDVERAEAIAIELEMLLQIKMVDGID